MLRKTVLGLAAAAALAATASTASAGVSIHFGGYGPYWGGYYAPYYGGYHCKKIFYGYKKVWTYYGWVKKPIFKKKCYW